MEEGHYHHHHHHHYHHPGHESQQQISSHGQSSSIERHQQESVSRKSEQQRNVTQPAPLPVIVPRPNEQPFSGVQATGSFHSVSSIDSSAEMARYFPDPQTPTLSPFRYHQKIGSQKIRPAAKNSISTINGGPYGPVSVPTAVQPPQRQPVKAPNLVPQQKEPIQAPAAPQLPTGLPSYTSQIEGLSVAQAIVNDVIVDLQSKVINETQQQYLNESASGNYFETLSPIYIRAPNPTIILRSDLHRLRAQLTTRPQGAAGQAGGINQFQQNTYQVPSFPPPQQHVPPESYGEYQNTAHVNG